LWGESIGSRSWSSLWISSCVLPLISLHSISCFGRIWVRRIWALVFLPLHPLHRFEFSSEIQWWKVRWAYYSWVLWTLDGLVA
jgi:hypothetical protein